MTNSISQQVERNLYNELLSGSSLLSVFKKRTHFCDKLLNEVFLTNNQPISLKDICIVAVGSYGRVELQHLSDLDLIILHNNLPKCLFLEMNKTFLKPLMQQTEREISIMNRPIEADAEDWGMNFHEKTVSFETRIILGSKIIFNQHRNKLKIFWNSQENRKQFYRELKADYNSHVTSGDLYTINIENVKKILRYYHLVYWASLYQSQKSFFDFLTGDIRNTLFESLNVLWLVREFLQYHDKQNTEEIKLEAIKKILATHPAFRESHKTVEQTILQHAQRLNNICQDQFNKMVVY